MTIRRKDRSHLPAGIANAGLYISWSNMISRCSHPTKSARWYFRKVCFDSSWSDFRQFESDMGDTHSAHFHLHRVEAAHGYQADNCVWLPIVLHAQLHRALRRENRTHCVNGHPWVNPAQFTRHNGTVVQECRICRDNRHVEFRRTHRQVRRRWVRRGA